MDSIAINQIEYIVAGLMLLMFDVYHGCDGGTPVLVNPEVLVFQTDISII